MRGIRKQLVGTVMAVAVLVAAEGGYSLFEKGLAKERGEADLAGAIKFYERVVREHAADRKLAVRALIRIGECHEKLGDADARRAYDRVVREFSDQTEAVAVARKRLASTSPRLRDKMAFRHIWTAPNRGNIFGMMSPDGRYVPYTAWEQNGDLFVHDLSTGADRRLTDTAFHTREKSEFAEECAFSRDSKQLAYSWRRDSHFEIRIVSLQGQGVPQPRRLLDNPELKWIGPQDWSPDNKWLAVALRRQDRTSQIGVVSVADGSLRVLKQVSPRDVTAMFFSPDGKYIAYDQLTSDSGGPRAVFVFSLDDNRDIPVTVHGGQERIAGWTPDGKRVLFISDRDGSQGVWAQPFSGGKVQGVPERIRSISFDRGGSIGVTSSGTLYFSIFNSGSNSDVKIGSVDSSRTSAPATNVAPEFPASTALPDWSPDGKYLAFIHRRSARVGIRSVETGQTHYLSLTPSLHEIYSIRWAPDVHSLAASGLDLEQRAGLFRIDVRNGKVTVIHLEPDRKPVPWGQEWSADGKSIYYHRTYLRRNMPPETVFSIKSVASGKERELLRIPQLTTMKISPDDKTIYYRREVLSGKEFAFVATDLASSNERELIRRPTLGQIHLSPNGRYIATVGGGATQPVLLIPLDTGEPREIMHVDPPSKIGIESWGSDGRFLVLRKSVPDSKSQELWRVGSDGSAPGKLNLTFDPGMTHLRLHPDGRQLAYTVEERVRLPFEVWALENFLK